MPNYAIIVAAGKGKRFRGKKQFVMLNHTPLLIHTLRPFEQSKMIDHIIVVVPKGSIDKTKKYIRTYRMKKVHKIVAGGPRRQDSVLRGFDTIKNQKGIVAIHDGVRPLISKTLINRGISLCKKYGAVIFGIKINDTIKQVKKRRVLKTVPRENLYSIQTPQFFKLSLLRSAFDKANLRYEYTDEASILESTGIPVYLFTGDKKNIKITHRSDLEFLKKFIK